MDGLCTDLRAAFKGKGKKQKRRLSRTALQVLGNMLISASRPRVAVCRAKRTVMGNERFAS